MSSLKSWVTEEDIGNTCAFLISNEASKIYPAEALRYE